MQYTERIVSLDWLAHNVVHLKISRPAGFIYEAGDAVELQVDAQEPGAFTMTSLPDEDALEFMIRVYKEHHGKTEALSLLKVGDEVSISEPFNTFQPKENAVFLAGGTGITPFIAIMREMHLQGTLIGCDLIFCNSTRQDLFLEVELRRMLGAHFHNVITKDNGDADYYGTIDEVYLRNHIGDLSRPVLVCGPPAFDEAMAQMLKGIGVEQEHIALSN